MRKMFFRAISICLTLCIMPFSAYAAEKSEIVYVNLRSNGSVRQIYVVNRLEAENMQQVLDYGNYTEIRNLSDLTPIEQNGNQISLNLPKGTLYYQGKLNRLAIPWSITATYRLNGAVIEPEVLAGQSGLVEMTLDIRKNESVNAVFFDNYALQISMTLDGDKCTGIIADGSTLVNSGKDRLLTYTVLPGSEKTFEIRMSVTNFEMGAISINGIPFSIDVGEVDTGELKDKLVELKDGIVDLDDGAKKIKTASKKLDSGTSSLSSGSSQFRKGIKTLASGSAELAANSTTVMNGLSALSSGLSQLSGSAESLKQGGDALVTGASELKAGLTRLNTQFDTLVTASSSISDGLSKLSSAAGSCSGDVSKLWGAYSAVNASSVASEWSSYTSSLAKVLKTMESLDSGLSNIISEYAVFDGGLGQVQSAIGSLNTATGSLLEGINAYTGPASQLANATSGIDLSGTDQFRAFDQAITQLHTGIQQLEKSYATIDSGIRSLDSGTGTLNTGAGDLKDGTDELREETSNIDERIDEEVDKALAKFKADDFEPISFVDGRNQVDLVQFVIRTDAIELPETEDIPITIQEMSPSFIDRVWALFE